MKAAICAKSKPARAPARAEFRRRRTPKALAPLLLAFSLCGCAALNGALELPERGVRALLALNRENPVADPVELQSQLLRFADNYVDTLNLAAGKLQQENGEPTGRRVVLTRRISVTNDVLAVATGANAYANLLDMVILAGLNRMNVEDYWLPKRYGDSALPLLLASREAEKEAWRIAATALQPAQIDELRAAIRAWHAQYPDGRSPRDVGSLGFSAQVARLNRAPPPGMGMPSVFNLLVIDPLAGLDPATRELANTRLFAERGMFLARHMPSLIRWETELLAMQTAEMPQVESLLASGAKLSASAERFSQAAERLPAQASAERAQIVAALEAQRPGLVSLAAQSEKALAAGRGMSEASAAALKSFQDVLRQLDARPAGPAGPPFRVGDYTAAAAQIDATAQTLAKLLQAFEQTLAPGNIDRLAARAEALGRQARADGEALVDYAFKKALLLGLLLIASACALALAAALAYARLKKKSA